MAKCDQGYLCEVCGKDVASITQSGLYLRYVIGEIEPQKLMSEPEHHLRCNPAMAQFIVDPKFDPVTADGPFDKKNLDPEDVKKREELMTRGWNRLNEVLKLGISISEYPLEEFRKSS